MQLFRDYEDKRFYKYLNYAKIMFLVAMILAIICGVGSLINIIIRDLILSVVKVFDYNEYIKDTYIRTCISYISFILIFLYFPIALYFEMRKIKKVRIPESKWINDFTFILWIVLFPLIFRAIFWLILIIMAIAVGYYSSDWVTILGYTFMPYIFVYIADIFLIKCLIIIKRDYNKNPPAFMQAKIKEKKKLERQKQNQLNNDNYDKYINEAGKKFFLKNYYLIKELSFADAMDTIEDKYSYEDKAKRINAVKKIFELKLEKLALKRIISEAAGDYNADIKAAAEAIYNKEFPVENKSENNQL